MRKIINCSLLLSLFILLGNTVYANEDICECKECDCEVCDETCECCMEEYGIEPCDHVYFPY